MRAWRPRRAADSVRSSFARPLLSADLRSRCEHFGRGWARGPSDLVGPEVAEHPARWGIDGDGGDSATARNELPGDAASGVRPNDDFVGAPERRVDAAWLR